MERNNRASMLSSALVIALCGGFAVSACNMLTGADRIALYEEDDDDASSGDPAGGGGNATTNTTGAGAGATVGSGGSATATSSNASSSAQQASSSSGGPDPCTYPAGPYGVAQGQTMPPSLSWQVYAPGQSSPSTVSTSDLFDCDGSKGIDVLIFDTSQYG